MTNSPMATGPTVMLSSASIGDNLEASLTLTLSQPAGTGGTNVTLTSADPTKVTLAGHAGDVGGATLVVPIAEGSTTVTGIYAQALAGSGTVAIDASATGFTSGSANMTLTPAGFMLAGPNGNGVPSFSTNQGLSTPLTVSAARLDASFNFAEVQPVRGGFSATVAVSSSNTSLATVTPSSVTLNGGDSSTNTQFQAVNSGAVTVTAAVPAGFSLPAQGANTLSVTINPAGLVPAAVTAGKGLENTTNITLNGVAPTGGLTVTITSNDPSRLLLSSTASGAGKASIDMLVPAGLGRTADFYVYPLDNTGTATYTAMAPGFGSTTGTVTLARSGFVIQVSGPVGTSSFLTTSGAPPTTVNVLAAILDAGSNYVATQALAGGTSASVSVTSSSTAVGTIGTSPVTVQGGSNQASTLFQPVSAGSTTLSVGTPAGFSAAVQSSIQATVITPGLAVTNSIPVGQKLQIPGVLSLGQAAPAGGLTVTLTSNSPGQLLLAKNATDAGSPSIMLNIAAGGTSAGYFIQAVGNSGTPTYTASAPGYASRTGDVPLTPSGAVIQGPFGLGAGFYFTTVAAGATTFTVSAAQLNPDNSFASIQQVAGGLSLPVTINNTNSNIATIASSLNIAGGTDHTDTNLTPKASGSTTVSVVTPSTGDNMVAVTVQ
jgi:hypothetical protein